MRQSYLCLLAASFCTLSACGSKGPGDAVSAADRKAALDALDEAIVAVPAAYSADNDQRLVQAIRAIPHFADAGATADGTVWGAFKDGALAFVIRPPPPEVSRPTPAPLAPSRTPPADLRGAGSRALVGTAPKSNRAQLFTGGATDLAPSDTRTLILSMLQLSGYAGTLDVATLANLRTVSGVGIFYIFTHGGLGYGNGGFLYALRTASVALDPKDEDSDRILVDDLLQQRVVYMGLRSGKKEDRHYGITGKFISNYMTFADDSLVYIDACSSASDQTFRNSFKNASVFVGWDKPALRSAISATLSYVFDRLLGANMVEPESPHQRPFPYDALVRDPRFGTGQKYGYSNALDFSPPIEANIGFYPLGVGHFAMLAPSIYLLMPNEDKDELVLLGSFGPDPGSDGKVLIEDGAEGELTVKDWSADGSTIKADLPRTGGGSSGDVTVTVRGHRSNRRQLIAWDGTFMHTLQDVGTLTQRFELDVRLRVDPHEVRDDPGTAPHANPAKAFGTNRNMAAHFEAAGTYSQPAGQCTFTYDWSGTGSIPVGLPSGGRSYVYSGAVEMLRGLAFLTAAAGDAQGGVNKVTQICPPPTGTLRYSNPLGISATSAPFHTERSGLDLQLDGTLNIAGGKRQHSQPGSLGPPATITLQWPAMVAKPQYNSTLPR